VLLLGELNGERVKNLGLPGVRLRQSHRRNLVIDRVFQQAQICGRGLLDVRHPTGRSSPTTGTVEARVPALLPRVPGRGR
jgi:hypothetical protein